MDGFTISNSNRFLEMGNLKETNSSVGLDSGPSIEAGQGTSFADTLKKSIAEVNQLQKKSDTAMQNLATGRTDNVAEVMIAAEKADIALRVMVQVRNKIIDAYNEVMKMQV
jgi:flagellar hook-basal body complex protein FliE